MVPWLCLTARSRGQPRGVPLAPGAVAIGWMVSHCARVSVRTARQAWWTLKQTNNAYERARAIADKDGRDLRYLLLRRSEWHDVFADLGVQTVDEDLGATGFLRLPSELFDTFMVDLHYQTQYRDHPDIDETGHLPMAPGIEVFLMLSLFGRGRVDEQMRFAFRRFDVDMSGRIDKEEFYSFIQCLTHASYKINLTDRPPLARELEELTESLFSEADVDDGGDVDVEEWVAWSYKHKDASALLEKFKTAKLEDEKLLLSTEDMMAQAAQAMAASTASVARRVNFRSRREQMGDGVSEMSKLLELTGYDTEQLGKLQERFAVIANGRALNRKQFVQAFTEDVRAAMQKARTARNRKAMKRSKISASVLNERVNALFDAFDVDKSGAIDFSELVFGLSRLAHGSVTDKLGLVFQLLDNNNSGSVEVKELVKWFTEGTDELVGSVSFAGELLAQMDKDNDGTVDAEEFHAFLEREPLLRACFMRQAIPKSLLDLAGDVEELGSTDEKFTLSYLKKSWGRVSKGSFGKSLTLAEFRTLMIKEFGATPQMAPLLERIFHAMDADGSGSLDMMELFSGLGSLFSGTPEERAEWQFKLLDEDGDGSLSRQEVSRLIMMSREGADARVENVVKVLNSLGADNRGRISLAQFTEAARTNPDALDLFTHVHGIANTLTPAQVAEQARLEQQRKEALAVKRKMQASMNKNSVSSVASLLRQSGDLLKLKAYKRQKAEDREKRLKQAAKRAATDAKPAPAADSGRSLEEAKTESFYLRKQALGKLRTMENDEGAEVMRTLQWFEQEAHKAPSRMRGRRERVRRSSAVTGQYRQWQPSMASVVASEYGKRLARTTRESKLELSKSAASGERATRHVVRAMVEASADAKNALHGAVEIMSSGVSGRVLAAAPNGKISVDGLGLGSQSTAPSAETGGPHRRPASASEVARKRVAAEARRFTATASSGSSAAAVRPSPRRVSAEQYRAPQRRPVSAAQARAAKTATGRRAQVKSPVTRSTRRPATAVARTQQAPQSGLRASPTRQMRPFSATPDSVRTKFVLDTSLQNVLTPPRPALLSLNVDGGSPSSRVRSQSYGSPGVGSFWSVDDTSLDSPLPSPMARSSPTSRASGQSPKHCRSLSLDESSSVRAVSDAAAHDGRLVGTHVLPSPTLHSPLTPLSTPADFSELKALSVSLRGEEIMHLGSRSSKDGDSGEKQAAEDSGGVTPLGDIVVDGGWQDESPGPQPQSPSIEERNVQSLADTQENEADSAVEPPEKRSRAASHGSVPQHTPSQRERQTATASNAHRVLPPRKRGARPSSAAPRVQRRAMSPPRATTRVFRSKTGRRRPATASGLRRANRTASRTRAKSAGSEQPRASRTSPTRRELTSTTGQAVVGSAVPETDMAATEPARRRSQSTSPSRSPSRRRPQRARSKVASRLRSTHTKSAPQFATYEEQRARARRHRRGPLAEAIIKSKQQASDVPTKTEASAPEELARMYAAVGVQKLVPSGSRTVLRSSKSGAPRQVHNGLLGHVVCV